MDLFTLLLAVGLILLILAVLSCFLLTPKERSFEDVKRENPSFSLLLDDKGHAFGGKAGKKDKKKKAKDGPAASDVARSRHSNLSKEDSQSMHSRLSQQESVSTEDSAVGSNSKVQTAVKSGKPFKKNSQTGSQNEETVIRSSTKSSESLVTGGLLADFGCSDDGFTNADGDRVRENAPSKAPIYSAEQVREGAGQTGARKRNKKGKKASASDDEFASTSVVDKTRTGEASGGVNAARRSMTQDEVDGSATTRTSDSGVYHQQMMANETVNGVREGGRRGQKDARGNKGVGLAEGSQSSELSRAMYSSETTSRVQTVQSSYSSQSVTRFSSSGAGSPGAGELGEIDRGEHVVPEEPKPSGGVGTPEDAPSTFPEIGRKIVGITNEQDGVQFGASKDGLNTILEQLRVIEFNESELRQIVHLLTERNTHTTTLIKAGMKPDPRIAEMEKLLLEKDQQLFNDQTVLSNANEKLKLMHVELATKDNSYRQLEQNCRQAIQQNQQKDVMLQETNARLIQLQQTVQAQSNINPQHYKQMQDENKNLKEQFNRLQADNARLQSELKMRDSQLAQSKQEFKRLQERCSNLEKMHAQNMKDLTDKAAENDRLAAESTNLKSQLTAERTSSERQIEEMNRRVESSVSVTSVHHVGSASNNSEDRIRKLEEEVYNLRAEISAADSSKSTMQAEVQRLNQEMEQKNEYLRELENTLQRLEENSAHFSKADAENTRLRDELSRIRSDLGAREARISDLTNQIEAESRDQMSELSAYRRDLETWEREKTESAARFGDLEARLLNKEREYQDELQKTKQQLAVIELEKASLLDKELSSDELSHKELESVRNAKNSLEALVSDLQASLSDVNHQLVEQATEITLIRNQMEDSMKRNRSLETELQEAVLGRKAAEAEKENLQMKVASMDDLDAQLSKLRDSLTEGDERMLSISKELETVSRTASEKEMQLKSMGDKVETLLRSTAEKEAELKELSGQYETSNQKLEEMTSKMNQLTEQLGLAVTQKNALAEEKLALAADNSKLLAKQSDLISEHDKLLKLKDDLLAEKAVLVTQRDEIIREKQALVEESVAVSAAAPGVESNESISLADQLEEAKFLLTQKDNRIQELYDELEMTSNEIAEKDEQLLTVQSQAAASMPIDEAKDGRKGEDVSLITQKDGRIQELMSQLQTLSSKLAEKEERLLSISADPTSTSEDSVSKKLLAEKDEKIQELYDQLETMTNELAEKDEQLLTLSAGVSYKSETGPSEINEVLAEKDEQIEKLLGQLEAVTNDLVEMEGTLSNKNRSNESAENSKILFVKDERIQELEDELETVFRELDDKKEKLKVASQVLQSAGGEIEKTDRIIAEKDERIQKLQDRIKAASSESTNKQAEPTNKLSQDLENARGLLEEKNERIHELFDQLEASDNAIAEKEEKLFEVSGDLEISKNAILDMDKRLTELTSMFEVTTTELSIKTKRIADLQNQLENASSVQDRGTVDRGTGGQPERDHSFGVANGHQQNDNIDSPIKSPQPCDPPVPPAGEHKDGTEVVIEWPENWGDRVEVTGYFWGWGPAKKLQRGGLGRNESDPPSIQLRLLPGRYEFKFLIDGVWTTSSHYPTVGTYLGYNIKNNYLIVEPNGQYNGELK